MNPDKVLAHALSYGFFGGMLYILSSAYPGNFSKVIKKGGIPPDEQEAYDALAHFARRSDIDNATRTFCDVTTYYRRPNASPKLAYSATNLSDSAEEHP